jgi:hypothetical protein
LLKKGRLRNLRRCRSNPQSRGHSYNSIGLLCWGRYWLAATATECGSGLQVVSEGGTK